MFVNHRRIIEAALREEAEEEEEEEEEAEIDSKEEQACFNCTEDSQVDIVNGAFQILLCYPCCRPA